MCLHIAKDIARNITKVMLHAITKVAIVLNDTWKEIAPIGLVKVIFGWNERKKQIDTVYTTNEQKIASIQMLESYSTLYKYVKSNYDQSPQREKVF